MPTKVVVYKLVKPNGGKGQTWYTRTALPMPLSIGKVVKFHTHCYASISNALRFHPDEVGVGLWTLLQCEATSTAPAAFGRGIIAEKLTPIAKLGTFDSRKDAKALHGLLSVLSLAATDKVRVAAFKKFTKGNKA